MACSAAYPAHPVMSIFSGERTFRFGAPSNSIFSTIFNYWNTPRMRDTDCATGHTNANYTNPIRILFIPGT